MNGNTLLLSANNFSFVNDEGENINVSNVHLVGEQITDQEGTWGHRVAKYSISDELLKKVKSIPCIVKPTYSVSINAKGQPSLKLTDIEYVKDYKLEV